MRTNISNDFVVSDRGGVIENRHAVHAAVIDSKGHLLYALGDPTRITLARSAAKPAQAVAILEAGAFNKYDLDDVDLALMCASHSSEERHITRARAILEKIGAEESDLKCGGHTPVSQAVNRAWIRNDFVPTSVCSNCSGKHAGMIAATKALGADVGTYHLEMHPLQVRVKRTVDEICGLGDRESVWSVDGCNLPAPAFPLLSLGQMYASFAEAVDMADGDGAGSARMQQQARVFRAMSRYPEFVAGEDRFCTILMRAFPGLLIGKLGADGCYGVGIRASEQTKRLGADGGLGIAVKIEDGNIGILYSAVSEVLNQLHIGDPGMRQGLAQFLSPEIRNTVGVVTGKVSPHFSLRIVQ
ncbi:uncharacterized protein N7484_003227 [Penicillium longicatenatum]|uniref:uncharacterized protein n=1 Tax=Penicillium longicatenatum TaxID=1561947 RepID=UPI0025478F79|nr:uncharacterized protein N7484_003227 [Penicillium longicatenatum]KAJ5649504.1 hypothetical protein N7484_003227 [Penicillium longicatenatum]